MSRGHKRQPISDAWSIDQRASWDAARGGAAAGEDEAPQRRTGAEMWQHYARVAGAVAEEEEEQDDSATAASSTGGGAVPGTAPAAGRSKEDAVRL